MAALGFIVLLVLAYLLGSVPFGLLVARAKGVDIQKVGSGNIGATNVFRMVSKPLGILTFVLDALKGFLPAWFFPILGKLAFGIFQRSELGLLCGVAAILGHTWPVFLRFKGGKGVATSAGVLLGVAPMAVVFGLLGWIVLFVTTRYVSVASIGAAVIVPVCAWTQCALRLHSSRHLLLPLVLTALGGLVIWRHRSNIQRLLDGEEHRFTFGKETRFNGPPPRHEGQPRIDTDGHG